MNTQIFPLALQQNGWVKKDECKCGGIHKVKFINPSYPNYIVEWWVKYYAFRVIKSNSTVQPQTPVKELQAWLVTFAAEQNTLSRTAAKQTVKTESVATPKAEPAKAEIASVAAQSEPIGLAEGIEQVVQTVKKDIELGKTPVKKTPKK